MSSSIWKKLQLENCENKCFLIAAGTHRSVFKAVGSVVTLWFSFPWKICFLDLMTPCFLQILYIIWKVFEDNIKDISKYIPADCHRCTGRTLKSDKKRYHIIIFVFLGYNFGEHGSPAFFQKMKVHFFIHNGTSIFLEKMGYVITDLLFFDMTKILQCSVLHFCIHSCRWATAVL